MKDFTFERLARATNTASAMAAPPGAMFLAGGTTLVDLMKVNVLTPTSITANWIVVVSRVLLTRSPATRAGW